LEVNCGCAYTGQRRALSGALAVQAVARRAVLLEDFLAPGYLG